VAARAQIDLFGNAPAWPDGFRYVPELIGPAEESRLIEHVRDLPFREFEFQGRLGKRRVVSYGWKYDFNDRRLIEVDDLPEFLDPLRHAAAAFAGLDPAALQQALVTEYGTGAGIGWHRDKAMFGDVVGVSLLAACTFRLRRKRGARWERVSVTAEPRSAYLMRGPSRTEWEHSIPPVTARRYSVTFRSFRERELSVTARRR
jgi:alkylated DNA repair dioxygenase AlkB